jgi:hypothetical protein
LAEKGVSPNSLTWNKNCPWGFGLGLVRPQKGVYFTPDFSGTVQPLDEGLPVTGGELDGGGIDFPNLSPNFFVRRLRHG